MIQSNPYIGKDDLQYNFRSLRYRHIFLAEFLEILRSVFSDFAHMPMIRDAFFLFLSHNPLLNMACF